MEKWICRLNQSASYVNLRGERPRAGFTYVTTSIEPSLCGGIDESKLSEICLVYHPKDGISDLHDDDAPSGRQNQQTGSSPDRRR